MPTTLSGRYRLDELIGGGGMGEVWRAHDEVLDRTVAIKIIRPHLADDENVRARLRVEAQLAGSLHHPGIVDVFDYGEDDEDGRPVPFLVMPLIDGAALSAVLAERRTLSTGETMAIVAEIAAALAAAHDAGIVHRDLKPGNILVTPDGRVMLVDFGIAHASGGEPLTQTGALIGTADYLSPEQASGRPATSASDLYALGVVAHTCLSGALPFHRDSDIATALAHLQDEPPELPATVPHDAVALVNQLLAKNPDERPTSATAVAQVAAPLATSVPTSPGHAPFLDGEPTMPDAAARPDDNTLPGIVERPVTVGASDAAATATLVGSVAPGAADTDPAGADQRGGSEVAAEHERGGHSSRRMVLLSSVVVAIVAAALGWMLMSGSDPVIVPDVDGMTQSKATTRLEAAGLEVEVRKVNVAGGKAGEVVDQDPASGEEVDEGAVVTISVATGRIKVPVDTLIGSTYDEAVAELDKLGLRATPQYEPSDESVGTVTAVDPSSTAKSGATITLTVSNGAPDLAEEDDSPDDSDKSNKGKGNKSKSGGGAKATPAEPTPSPSPDPSTSPDPESNP
ncbi:protein kinase [Aeromicrobium sp.]|uniref:protein kinase domain-containing protein n=1 Tax=Aeromicrobium sp. TaxID=1871063 RepID=UPI0030BFB420